MLVIQLDVDAKIKIGAIGEKTFEQGIYLYVGSAQNNLLTRIKRHLKKEKCNFWHIDYLLEHFAASVIKVVYAEINKIGECRMANEISKHGYPVNGFGCSDCHCKSHLYRVGNITFLQDLTKPFQIV